MCKSQAAVRAQEFRVVFRGYDVEEVDAFLDWIEQDLTRLAQGPDAAAPVDPSAAGASAQAVRTLLHAEQAAERMLAEAAADAAAIRERAHAEARGIVADARAEAAHVVAAASRRPSADVEELVVGAQRLRAELDRLGESERRCREQLQTWLDGHGRLFDRGPVAAGPEVAADPYRRDTGTTVRRVVTTLPAAAVR
ncbi:DivIVA domain-containing protein [Geodermatophilus chilensis]|uniref:DivIVA domain-containing protein n=1 Tax=Geodermatophilus chilensis TaxID=2035835 RepID=UPI0018E46189|nr:DivIVA domain-containing protein [Geodermatophilus chilensis]